MQQLRDLRHQFLTAARLFGMRQRCGAHFRAAVWTRFFVRPDVRIASPADFEAGWNAALISRFPGTPGAAQRHQRRGRPRTLHYGPIRDPLGDQLELAYREGRGRGLPDLYDPLA